MNSIKKYFTSRMRVVGLGAAILLLIVSILTPMSTKVGASSALTTPPTGYRKLKDALRR